MKSTIFICFYAFVGVLGLGLNYYQLQRLLESSNAIIFILITLVMALQVPLYFLYRRSR